MTSERISGAALRVAAAAAGLTLLAACGGGSSGASPSPSSSPCTDTTNATLTLVSPAPGSTGNSAGTQGSSSIRVQASAPIPATVEFELIDKNGSTQLGGQVTGSNPYTAAGFTLTSGDTYNVYLLNTAQPTCTATAIAGASFST